jgi:hypothetical protein
MAAFIFAMPVVWWQERFIRSLGKRPQYHKMHIPKGTVGVGD